eukprot:5195622-Pleurochrysis_carterae.AAC.1
MFSARKSSACGWVEISSAVTVSTARSAARTASARRARARPARPGETQAEGMPASCDIVHSRRRVRGHVAS